MLYDKNAHVHIRIRRSGEVVYMDATGQLIVSGELSGCRFAFLENMGHCLATTGTSLILLWDVRKNAAHLRRKRPSDAGRNIQEERPE